MYKRSSQGWLKHIDFILWDVAVLQLSLLLAFMLRHHGSMPYSSDTYRMLSLLYILVDILIAAVFNTMHNVMKRGYWHEFVQSFKQAALVLVIMALYMFSFKTGGNISRITVYLTAIFHLFFGYLSRKIWKQVVLKTGWTRPKARMLLVTQEEKIPDIVKQVSQADNFEYVGLVLSNRDAKGEEISGLPVVANLSNAAEYICREWIDEVLIYPSDFSDIEVHRSPLTKSVEGFIVDDYSDFVKKQYEPDLYLDSEKATVPVLIEQCRQMSVPVHIRLPLSNVGGKTFMEKVGGFDVLTSASNYASPLQLAMKRAIDLAGGMAGSLVALIIIAVVGPKIKRESPGPILFKQIRIGQNGKKFQIYKLRTMYPDAEERKKEFVAQNRVSDGMMFKLDWDPRIIGNKIVDGKQVTGFGEKLRSGSWDEWPQFFNILLGQMSLVGTRPPTVDEWEKYKYHHRARLAMKPGLTGLWQVSGRSKITDFEEVVRLDTEYINHWSMGLDFRILIRTIKTVLYHDGAM